MRGSRYRPTGVLALMSAWCWPCSVEAGNGDSFFLSDQAAMTGGAVVAAGNDVGMAWYNPAGLAVNRRNELSLTGTMFVLRVQHARNEFAIRLPDGSTQGNDISGVQGLIVAPSVVFARRVGERVTAAFGVFITQSDYLIAQGSFNATLADGSVVRQGTFASTNSYRYYVGPTVGVELAPRVRLGAALFGVYETTGGLVGLSLDYTSATGSQVVLGGQIVNNPSRYSGELAVGLQWRPGDHLSVGFVARSPRIMAFESPTQATQLAVGARVPGMDPVLMGGVDNNQHKAGPGLIGPAKFTLGAALELSRGWVGVEGDYSHSLRNGEADIHLDSLWNVRAGGMMRLSKKLGVGAGFFTDRSAEVLDVATGPVHFYGVSGGIQFGRSVRVLREEKESKEAPGKNQNCGNKL